MKTEESLKNKTVGNVNFPPRKVWIHTYGCQMNHADSDRLTDHLKKLNFSLESDKEKADLLLFNTCAVRDKANQKFYSHLGETKKLKTEKDVVIGVGGCVAQTEGQDLLKKYRHLDFAFGPDAIEQIPDMVYRAYAGERKFVVNKWDRAANYSIETKVHHGTPQANVNIIKGCDKFCSYCIVPFTRGREKSRELAEVVKDVKNLVEYQGIQEITLLGQNVNSYGKERGESLAQLLFKLEEIDGLQIVRYTTSHPYDMSDELIEAHRVCQKLANHVHLPVQSGSDTVLKRMLREHTTDHYLELISKLRTAKPGIKISSDIIVGFPNETRSEHEESLKLLRSAKFDFIFSYAFSPRKGTKAARMDDFLTKEVRSERLQELQKMQLDIQKSLREEMNGRTYTVLVDGQSAMKGIKKFRGRTNCMRIVHFEPQDLDKDYMWNWVDVKVTSSTALSAQGKIQKVHGKYLTSEILY